MTTYEQIRNIQNNNKEDLDRLQFAAISGISSYIYSAYIAYIKQKIDNDSIIFNVPSINYVSDLFKEGSLFLSYLRDTYIDDILNCEVTKGFNQFGRMFLNIENSEDPLKIIFNLSIIPTIVNYFPQIIIKKLGIGTNPNMIEDNTIDPFNEINSEDARKFIVYQTALTLAMENDNVKKSINYPENNSNINIERIMHLSIENEYTVAPIYFQCPLLSDACTSLSRMLRYVTGLNVDKYGVVSAPIFSRVKLINIL